MKKTKNQAPPHEILYGAQLTEDIIMGILNQEITKAKAIGKKILRDNPDIPEIFLAQIAIKERTKRNILN